MGYKVEEKQPEIDLWSISIDGLLRNPKEITHEELVNKPSKEIKAELVCLQGKVLTGTWKGTALSELLKDVSPIEEAKYISVISYGGFQESIKIKNVDEIFIAYYYNGKPIDKEHGGPYRLIAPKKYAYKNIKWVKEIRLTNEAVSGYWEEKGYPDVDEAA